MIGPRPLLIVEDSDEDYEVTVWALRRAGVDLPIVRHSRAEPALAALFEPDPSPSGAYPCMVLLDLNLPGTDGRQMLEAIYEAECRPQVPVVVLSTSTNPQDVRMSYRLGAAGYICKPLSLDVFVDHMAAFARYWFHAAVLPDSQR